MAEKLPSRHGGKDRSTERVLGDKVINTVQTVRRIAPDGSEVRLQYRAETTQVEYIPARPEPDLCIRGPIREIDSSLRQWHEEYFLRSYDGIFRIPHKAIRRITLFFGREEDGPPKHGFDLQLKNYDPDGETPAHEPSSPAAPLNNAQMKQVREVGRSYWDKSLMRRVMSNGKAHWSGIIFSLMQLRSLFLARDKRKYYYRFAKAEAFVMENPVESDFLNRYENNEDTLPTPDDLLPAPSRRRGCAQDGLRERRGKETPVVDGVPTKEKQMRFGISDETGFFNSIVFKNKYFEYVELIPALDKGFLTPLVNEEVLLHKQLWPTGIYLQDLRTVQYFGNDLHGYVRGDNKLELAPDYEVDYPCVDVAGFAHPFKLRNWTPPEFTFQSDIDDNTENKRVWQDYIQVVSGTVNGVDLWSGGVGWLYADEDDNVWAINVERGLSGHIPINAQGKAELRLKCKRFGILREDDPVVSKTKTITLSFSDAGGPISPQLYAWPSDVSKHGDRAIMTTRLTTAGPPGAFYELRLSGIGLEDENLELFGITAEIVELWRNKATIISQGILVDPVDPFGNRGPGYSGSYSGYSEYKTGQLVLWMCYDANDELQRVLQAPCKRITAVDSTCTVSAGMISTSWNRYAHETVGAITFCGQTISPSFSGDVTSEAFNGKSRSGSGSGVIDTNNQNISWDASDWLVTNFYGVVQVLPPGYDHYVNENGNATHVIPTYVPFGSPYSDDPHGIFKAYPNCYLFMQVSPGVFVGYHPDNYQVDYKNYKVMFSPLGSVTLTPATTRRPVAGSWNRMTNEHRLNEHGHWV